ncbi:NAD(P)H-dependent oxidoreductase [Pseudoalteromonas maricaloris]|uniref:NAD(P)H-dependent oxidoreductase n=1 Tax=Pseudoalteromonas maricaloris TaxID=184924 RepID=UPI00057DAE89|nr:NAD(P)H-dependent oxidoreductase [Pseudoalteromonas flavipulchra]KID38604.1 NAD(P)H dehydrogenase [Pseudoalteromonas flavipulchra NCIMB 2033 = ATCC BAA-314]MBD0783149.1 NAD(P)H-dependent oxidoreductase [Pseudoalteromonas flavipulchra]MBE0371967.1 NAD(P)H dehydrogenase (quinone) [Pseudoalteromonas flavipulchra NCIMB 2033 = ATCC BAA-314]
MTKSALVVSAHPEPTSLTQTLAKTSVEALTRMGLQVQTSDLYQMDWKAVVDATDFPQDDSQAPLAIIAASGKAYHSNTLTEDVIQEQQKLLAADLVIFHFPLWWYSVPAILKGWFDRVYAYGFAYGYQNKGNQLRYGEGVLQGKRALICVTTGGGYEDYSPLGINGTMDELLFPITHGTLFFPGMDVLQNHVIFDAKGEPNQRITDEIANWSERLTHVFSEKPIPYRKQNSGDYINGQVLKAEVAMGKSGIVAHIA